MGQEFPKKFFERKELERDERPRASGPARPVERIGTDSNMISAFDAEFATPPGVTPRLLKSICKLRKERQDFVPAKLLADPAWDILLQLYAAHVEQHRISISRLTERTGLAGTTTLRWLGNLTSAGMVSRSDDPTDSRRVFVSLTPAGILAMNRYFARTGTWTIFL